MHMVKKNNFSFSGAFDKKSLSFPFLSPYHYRLAHSGKHVAWHNFKSLTWTCGNGKGRRCWLDVSFTLGDKLLCEQAILDFQGHRMHLRDCQRSAFMLLVTLKTTNRRVILHTFWIRRKVKQFFSIILSFCLILMSRMHRRCQQGIKLGMLIKLNICHQINASQCCNSFNHQ